MTDRPILFSAPMVRALLAGTKTQTRRMLGLRGHESFTEFGPSDTAGYDWHFRDAGMRWHDLRDAELKGRLRISVSDRLWVRESWSAQFWTPEDIDGPAREYMDTPKAERTKDLLSNPYFQVDEDAKPSLYRFLPEGRWAPSIHMPLWASRLTLHVTDVRVQRLQDISPDDAMDEGCPTNAEPLAWYLEVWETINGAGTWDKNPWVCAITFTVERCNIAEAAP